MAASWAASLGLAAAAVRRPALEVRLGQLAAAFVAVELLHVHLVERPATARLLRVEQLFGHPRGLGGAMRGQLLTPFFHTVVMEVAGASDLRRRSNSSTLLEHEFLPYLVAPDSLTLFQEAVTL